VEIKVYVSPDYCPACDRTKKYLERKDVPFTVEEVDEEIREKFLTETDFRQFPVVVTPKRAWSGFSPVNLSETVSDYVKFLAEKGA